MQKERKEELMEIIKFVCLLISLVLILIIAGNFMPWWLWVVVLGASAVAGVLKAIENNKKAKSKGNDGYSIQNFSTKPAESVNSWERCTCTKQDAKAILAAAEIMYQKKYKKLPSKSTCTKEHAKIILKAATMMYQKKYNKFSKSDVYNLREELDDDFDDFYDDLLNQIYDVDSDMTFANKKYEDEVLEWINYYENTLRFS